MWISEVALRLWLVMTAEQHKLGRNMGINNYVEGSSKIRASKQNQKIMLQ